MNTQVYALNHQYLIIPVYPQTYPNKSPKLNFFSVHYTKKNICMFLDIYYHGG